MFDTMEAVQNANIATDQARYTYKSISDSEKTRCFFLGIREFLGVKTTKSTFKSPELGG